MKAIRIHETGRPEVLRLEEVADPQPEPGEAVVRLEAIGLNFIEVYQRTGLYRSTLPFTPGGEGAGQVVSVYKDVSAVKPGDRVASTSLRGSYAELARVPVDKLVPIPNHVETTQAAAVLLQGLTAHYLATSTHPLAQGSWCLIHAAAGGVGLLLCQVAKARGARVIGTVSTEEKAILASQAGADHVVLYTRQDFVSEARRLTGGQGVAVVYDSVGQSTFEGSLNSLAPRGMLVLFGQSSGPVAPIDPQVLNTKGSLFLTRPTVTHYPATPSELLTRARDLFAWMEAGRLEVRIDRTYPLAEAAAAYRSLEGRETKGKVLLLP